MSFSLGVIGFGRMAQAIVFPLVEKGQLKPEEIFGLVRNKKTKVKLLDQLPKKLKILSNDDVDKIQVWSYDVILLAVKPQDLPAVKEQYPLSQDQLPSKKPLLISILAGVSLQKLESFFPWHACVRAVPNTPAMVGAGLTGLSWGEGVTASQRLLVEEVFRSISELFELQEEKLDAFLALTSSGPAYVALIAEALADGAVAAGLSRSLANHLANRTLSGSALLLKEKELHPGQLKDMVSSPAGTTITALRHLEMAGIRSALIEAVVLAAERSRELA